MIRTTSLFLLFSAAALFLSSADAFTMHQSRAMDGLQTRAASKQILSSILKMSETPEGGEPTAEEVVQSKVSADGTFYDDELDSAPVKTGISDSMRARLMAEASTGLDSNQSQTNVILYICIGVAVLVALGGSGILY